MDILKRVSLLPDDLKQYILKYTHKPQPFQLTNDIRHFIVSKEIISIYYFEMFHTYIPYEENSDRNWLINDISGFLNNHIATMYGLIENYKSTFRNLWGVKDTTNLIRIIDKKSVETQINIYWASMTILQRERFLKWVYEYDLQ